MLGSVYFEDIKVRFFVRPLPQTVEPKRGWVKPPPPLVKSQHQDPEICPPPPPPRLWNQKEGGIVTPPPLSSQMPAVRHRNEEWCQCTVSQKWRVESKSVLSTSSVWESSSLGTSIGDDGRSLPSSLILWSCSVEDLPYCEHSTTMNTSSPGR